MCGPQNNVLLQQRINGGELYTKPGHSHNEKRVFLGTLLRVTQGFRVDDVQLNVLPFIEKNTS